MVGEEDPLNATCTPPAHVSVAQVVESVALVLLVYDAPVFILNDPHDGGTKSPVKSWLLEVKLPTLSYTWNFILRTQPVVKSTPPTKLLR